MILQLGLKPKIPDQRKELDCSEFMFKNKPGHIAINKCKQEPDANYSFVPFMKIFPETLSLNLFKLCHNGGN